LSTIRGYLELLRLPNVFTAIADVMMGYLVTHRTGIERPGLFVLILLSSTSLYLAGMVLNDVFDVAVDTVERPQRPIPSGRVRLGMARRSGGVLLALGILAAWLVSIWSGDARAGTVASFLAFCILLYEGMAKKTVLGPLVMGGCRSLNVLLGMSLAAGPWASWHGVIAVGIGVYIVGVTWFARSEARTSRRLQLALATFVVLGGIAIVAQFPRYAANVQSMEPGIGVPPNWYLFWLVIAALAGWRYLRAVVDPAPAVVQAAVKQGILSLIVIDAAVCYAASGTAWALAVLALIVPAMLVGRWIYST